MSFTLIIVIITVLVSLAAFNNQELNSKLILWPYRMDSPSEYYRLITCGFIHADYIHLFFNMFALYVFGQSVETLLAYNIGKTFLFPVLYLTGIIAASLPSFSKHKHDGHYRSLGASGGVSAVLFAFVYFAPWQIITIWFIPVPAVIAAVGYLIYSAYMGKKGSDNIGHDAHFWGAVYGFLFTLLFEPSHGRLFLQELMNLPF